MKVCSKPESGKWIEVKFLDSTMYSKPAKIGGTIICTTRLLPLNRLNVGNVYYLLYGVGTSV